MPGKYERFYLKVSINFKKEPVNEISLLTLRAAISQALIELHGEVGSAIPVDVLKIERTSNLEHVAILRLPFEEKEKLWSSLTLMNQYNGSCCVCRVRKASHQLMALTDLGMR